VPVAVNTIKAVLSLPHEAG